MNHLFGTSVPYVLDNKKQERVLDLWSRLNQDRVVFISEEIEPRMASIVVAQLMYLESQDKVSPIYLYINSPGGVVSAGLSIFDTINYISPPVHTVCVGIAASMASILLAGGEKGHRYMTENSEVMIHQPSTGTGRVQVTDLEIVAKHGARTKERLTKIMSNLTGQEYNKCLEDMERDYYMTAEEAVEYGLVDSIFTSRKDGDEDAEK